MWESSEADLGPQDADSMALERPPPPRHFDEKFELGYARDRGRCVECNTVGAMSSSGIDF